mmetsp:Transcript_9293/g.17326  ORF Transcript_9293/g.17326 Transcript_9293/m.17326 type:complete len:228 (-) Transcript_9293:1684-2367(-)
MPSVLVIQLLGRLQGNLNIAALNGKVELDLLIVHEMESNLREALLLQIRNDSLAAQLRVTNHVNDLIVLLLQQGQLEDVLCGVYLNLSSFSISIQTVNGVGKDFGQVYRVIKCLHNAVVSIWQAIFDVVESSVQEHTRVVPGTTLNSNALVDCVGLSQFLVAHDDSMLAKECDHCHLCIPNNIFHWRRAKLAHHVSLLHVEHHHLVFRLAQHKPGSSIKDSVSRGCW